MIAELAPPRKLPRVLYAIVLEPGQKFGSLEEQMCLLSRAFREQGGLFLPLFIAGQGKLGDYERQGVVAECLDLRSFRRGVCRALVGLADRHGIDLVHWNFTPPARNPYLWALSLARPRLRHCLTDHNSRHYPLPGPGRGWKRLAKRAAVARYDKVFAVSEFVARCLRDQGAWRSVACVRHFVNTERFAPDEAARERLRRDHGAADCFVVLVVANLIPDKGVDTAIRAVAQLPPDAVLWVVGDGPERAALEGLAAQLLPGRVRFFGLQAHVEPYLQAADCLACPSRWAEAAGLVLLEAQAAGLPVVATEAGGIPEYVRDGHTGWLVPRDDVAAFTGRLGQLRVDSVGRAAMAQAARGWALAEFSPARQVPVLLEQYRTLV